MSGARDETVAFAPLAEEDPRLDRLAAAIADAPLNLVASGERSEVRPRHVDEARAVAAGLAGTVRTGDRWMDLGTGGGLPGLVLAMAYPAVEWLLVDSIAKKTAAVGRFAHELGLTNVEVITGRAEVLAWRDDLRGGTAGVVARAVAPLRVLSELARGFVGERGWLAAVKGPGWVDDAAAAAAALERCGWSSPQGVRLASPIRETWLVTMQAVGHPPVGIPRRAGVPQRRPF